MSGFEKILHAKNHLWFILLQENEIFCIFGAFLKAWFWNESFQKASDFDLKFYSASDLQLRKKHFQICIERVIFSLKKDNTSVFQLKVLQPLRDDLTSGSFQL